MTDPRPEDCWVPRSWHEAKLAEVRAIALEEVRARKAELELEFARSAEALRLCVVEAASLPLRDGIEVTIGIQRTALMEGPPARVVEAVANQARRMVVDALFRGLGRR